MTLFTITHVCSQCIANGFFQKIFSRQRSEILEMEFNYLKNILNELIRRLDHRNLPHEFELKRELHYLNENERKIIQSQMKNQQFNIGTFAVMKILQEENIMSFCEYLESVNKDNFEVMKIITELFDDSINNLELLMNVLASNKFQALIDESLKNYIQDLVQHPELIKIELITSTCQTLSSNIFQNSILKKSLYHLVHFNVVEEDTSDLTHVITKQKEWNEEFLINDKLTAMFKSMMQTHSEFIAKELKSMIRREGTNFNWFYVLMIVNYFNADSSGYKTMKGEHLINIFLAFYITTLCRSHRFLFQKVQKQQ